MTFYFIVSDCKSFSVISLYWVASNGFSDVGDKVVLVTRRLYDSDFFKMLVAKSLCLWLFPYDEDNDESVTNIDLPVSKRLFSVMSAHFVKYFPWETSAHPVFQTSWSIAGFVSKLKNIDDLNKRCSLRYLQHSEIPSWEVTFLQWFLSLI